MPERPLFQIETPDNVECQACGKGTLSVAAVGARRPGASGLAIRCDVCPNHIPV